MAIVDEALPANARTPEGLSVADLRARHRDLARATDSPLLDPVYGNGGSFRNATLQAEADHYALHVAPRLRAALDAALTKWAGFGHFSAAVHEWTAAAVFYGLVEAAAGPAVDAVRRPELPANDCEGSLCRLAGGAATSFTFDDVECGGPHPPERCGRPVSDGWVFGEDVAGKPGWIHCDSPKVDASRHPAAWYKERQRHRSQVRPGEIAFRLTCDRGDLVVGYLESFDERMGTVLGAVSQAGDADTTFAIDAFNAQRRSIFAMKTIPGLSSGVAIVTFAVDRPDDDDDRPVLERNETCVTVLTDPACCHRDKFKLLSLTCT